MHRLTNDQRREAAQGQSTCRSGANQDQDYGRAHRDRHSRFGKYHGGLDKGQPIKTRRQDQLPNEETQPEGSRSGIQHNLGTTPSAVAAMRQLHQPSCHQYAASDLREIADARGAASVCSNGNSQTSRPDCLEGTGDGEKAPSGLSLGLAAGSQQAGDSSDDAADRQGRGEQDPHACCVGSIGAAVATGSPVRRSRLTQGGGKFRGHVRS
jgi:hypothetical protein